MGQSGPGEHLALGEERNSEKKRELRLRQMLEVEDQMLQRAAGVLDAFLSFHEVDPEATDPPAAWVAEYGPEGARQRFEVARRGWAPQNETPGGVKLAQMTYVGIQKARGRSAAIRANNLNVAIQLPAPTTAEHPGPTVYPTLEIE